jgi:2,3-bisphosphoglycerate-dependent phosphoglycerate mutase
MDELYIVRHCEATGQAPDAPLTEVGLAQAEALAAALPRGVDRIISSPYKRALQSITPFADRHGLAIEIDDRLRERALGSPGATDWRKALEATFEDHDLRFADGESNRAAMQRGVAVIDGIAGASRPMVVTHGNLMAMLLRSFDPSVGFEHWSRLTNPDVYQVTFGAGAPAVRRIDVKIQGR